jgi:Zn-dependent M28 family amino/carboxypeptidase
MVCRVVVAVFLTCLAHEGAAQSATLARDISVLAADSMEGRGTGTPGGARARAYLLRRFAEIGLRPLSGGYELPFDIRSGNNGTARRGVNLVGQVRGSALPETWIVVSAHYDHLGVRNGTVYNGADDNASGVAGLLALAQWAVENPPQHSILFVAFDAEELGLRGASAFVDAPPVARDAIAINVNMDMIGRNVAGELYVAGTAHYPPLAPLVDSIAVDAPVRLLRGHDRPGSNPSDDWTDASDHGPFHRVGIPFLYFGEEDHPDYHRATDDSERIQAAFHANAVETVRRTIEALDRALPGLNLKPTEGRR